MLFFCLFLLLYIFLTHSLISLSRRHRMSKYSLMIFCLENIFKNIIFILFHSMNNNLIKISKTMKKHLKNSLRFMGIYEENTSSVLHKRFSVLYGKHGYALNFKEKFKCRMLQMSIRECS